MIQNMSVFICSNCGHQSHIFGENGAAQITDELGIPLIGMLTVWEAIFNEFKLVVSSSVFSAFRRCTA